MARPRQPHAPPTRAEVAALPRGRGCRAAGRNEILQALTRGRGDRAVIKEILRELAAEGRGRRRRKPQARPAERSAEVPPSTTVLDVTGIDADGDLLLTYPEQPELRIVLPVENLEGTAPGVGDRVLARLQPAGEGGYEARPIRVLPRQPREVTGIVESGARRAAHPLGRPQGAGRVRGRRGDDLGGAEPGDLVRGRDRCPTGGWGWPAPRSRSGSAGRTIRRR